MKNLIESKAFPWIAAVVVGVVMGFLVGPLVTGLTFHESLPYAGRFVLAIIGAGITGLVIEKALANRPAPVEPDRKSGKVDTVFGVGRVVYTVTPCPKTGRFQFNVTTHGVTGRKFRDVLIPMLKEIEGVEWGTPTLPGRAALKQHVQRLDAIEKGLVPPPPIETVRGVSGVITSDARLARVIEMVEERLGSAQPL